MQGLALLTGQEKGAIVEKMFYQMGPKCVQNFKSALKFIYGYVYISVCLYAQMYADACGGQKKASDFLELELQGSCKNHPVWVLTTHKSSNHS